MPSIGVTLMRVVLLLSVHNIVEAVDIEDLDIKTPINASKIVIQSNVTPDTDKHAGLMPPSDQDLKNNICNEVGDRNDMEAGDAKVFKIPDEPLFIGFLCDARNPNETFVIWRTDDKTYQPVDSKNITTTSAETPSQERDKKVKYDHPTGESSSSAGGSGAQQEED